MAVEGWYPDKRDLIKMALMDYYCSPKLDKSILKALNDCAVCKNFSGTHLHSLLEPITRRQPFELMVADYLSVQAGKGKFHTIALFMDVFSEKVWDFKYKTAGTAKTTLDGLNFVVRNFKAPDTFMTDGGSHFNNNDVHEYCDERSIRYEVVAKYSPWVNGLLEGTNGKLLGRLKHLCAPGLGEDEYEAMGGWESLPKNWPDHLEEAVRCLNERILPALKFSPNELCLGLVINGGLVEMGARTEELGEEAAVLHMSYVEQQRVDGYAEVMEHAAKRKTAFDTKVLAKAPKEVIFEKGQLVQVYRRDLDYTFRNKHKLLPKL